jgi:NRPS condensation-like uncharacterized protein
VESSLSSIPLNCVDKSLLALDSINEPMLFHIILSLEGGVDHVRLNQAIFSAQEAYPVMRTILRSRHFRSFRQIQEDLREGVLSVSDQAQLQDTNYESYLSQWMNQPLDIKSGFPVKVLLLRKNELESSLVFTFHHSAADGRGSLLFVSKVIESYNDELSKNSESEGDIGVNRKGDKLLQFAHGQRSKVEHYYRKMVSSLFHRFIIAALPPPTKVFHDRTGRSRELRFYFKVVNPGELEEIQFKARSAGVAVNDILLAACHRVVEKWNRIHGKASKRLRIMAPVDIGPKEFRDVVFNQVSWISLSTTPKERADPIKLLRTVKADTTDAARNRAAFSLIYFFYFCSRFPLWVMKGIARLFLITRIYVDTIIVTNVGFIWPKSGSGEPAVSNMGNARIVNVSISAPVVTPMGLSITVVTYNRNLNLCLSYRSALFSEEKAQMFLDLYVEEIKQYQVVQST